MSGLQIAWFVLLAIFLAGYTVLAGFDLGLGILLLPARAERKRRALMNGLGPFWDGNEVWLICAGALLFAVFPPVYAALFSGFYPWILLALFAIIGRAFAIESARHSASPYILRYWSLAVGLGSLLAAVLLGAVLGNVLRGVALDAEGVFTGSAWEVLNPYALLVGVLNLALITTHGALYLAWKAEGETAKWGRRWAQAGRSLSLTLLVFILPLSVAYPHLLRNFLRLPVLWLVPLLAIGALVAAGLFNARQRGKAAFYASAAAITLLLGTAAIALFPVLVPVPGNPARSLTIAGASSSPLSLLSMLIITLIGMPVVIGYTVWVYRVFGGKIEEETPY